MKINRMMKNNRNDTIDPRESHQRYREDLKNLKKKNMSRETDVEACKKNEEKGKIKRDRTIPLDQEKATSVTQMTDLEKEE